MWVQRLACLLLDHMFAFWPQSTTHCAIQTRMHCPLTNSFGWLYIMCFHHWKKTRHKDCVDIIFNSHFRKIHLHKKNCVSNCQTYHSAHRNLVFLFRWFCEKARDPSDVLNLQNIAGWGISINSMEREEVAWTENMCSYFDGYRHEPVGIVAMFSIRWIIFRIFEINHTRYDSKKKLHSSSIQASIICKPKAWISLSPLWILKIWRYAKSNIEVIYIVNRWHKCRIDASDFEPRETIYRNQRHNMLYISSKTTDYQVAKMTTRQTIVLVKQRIQKTKLSQLWFNISASNELSCTRFVKTNIRNSVHGVSRCTIGATSQHIEV